MKLLITCAIALTGCCPVQVKKINDHEERISNLESKMLILEVNSNFDKLLKYSMNIEQPPQ